MIFHLAGAFPSPRGGVYLDIIPGLLSRTSVQ